MPIPTDLPSNTAPEALVRAINQRLEDIRQLFQDEYQHNPALGTFNMQTERIVNLADPRQDFDAVNLRTLKRVVQPPTLPPILLTSQAQREDQFLFRWFLADDTVGTEDYFSNPADVNTRWEVVTFTGRVCQIWWSCRVNPTLYTPNVFFELSTDSGLTWEAMCTTTKGVEPTDFNHATTHISGLDADLVLEPGNLIRIKGQPGLPFLSGFEDALIVLVCRGVPSCDGLPASLDS